MADTLDTLKRKIDQLSRALSDQETLAQAYAEIAVAQARRRAQGRPTPQARMVASGVSARQGSIYGSASAIVSGRGGSVALGEIAWGSEYGSTLFRQFGPRHARGSWLYPAAEDDATVDLFETDVIDATIEAIV